MYSHMGAYYIVFTVLTCQILGEYNFLLYSQITIYLHTT